MELRSPPSVLLAAAFALASLLLPVPASATTVVGRFDGTVFDLSAPGTPLPIPGLLSVQQMAVDASNRLVIADGTGDAVVRWNGTTAETLATIDLALGLAIAANGDIYVSAQAEGNVYRLPAAGGAPVPFASGLAGPRGIRFDAAGHLWVAEQTGGSVLDISAGGSFTGSPRDYTGLSAPIDVIFNTTGQLLVSEATASRIKNLATTATIAIPSLPHYLAFSAAGALLVTTNEGVYDATGSSYLLDTDQSHRGIVVFAGAIGVVPEPALIPALGALLAGGALARSRRSGER